MEYQLSEIFVTSWGDLKADQAATLLYWRDRLVKAIADKQSKVAGWYKALIVRYLCQKPKIFKQLSTNQIIDIADNLNFIHQSWYQFHITYIRLKNGTKLYPPDEKLSSFTFLQLVKADAEYSRFLIYNYRNSPEQHHALDRLVAILYQPELGSFDENHIEQTSNKLPKALTFDLKYLILHTYSNCRKYIVNERCPNLFPKSAPTDEVVEPQYTGEMWQNMLFDLSETPAFSGLETAKSAKIYNALDYLEQKAIQNKPKKK